MSMPYCPCFPSDGGALSRLRGKAVATDVSCSRDDEQVESHAA